MRRKLAFIALAGLLVSNIAFAALPSSDQEFGNVKKGLGGAFDLFKASGTSAGFPENAVPPEVIVGQYIQTGIVVIGALFGVLIVYAGYLWMTARGNETQAKKAMDILKDAAVGLVIVIGAYAITSFVVNRIVTSALQEQTTTGSGG